MIFDEIYKIAIWASDVAEEYGVPVTKINELVDELSKSHRIDEVKNIIEKGFIEGVENERRNVERESM